MGDFLAILGAGSRASDLSRLLRERPFLAEREVETARFGWGAVTLLVAPGRGYRPGTRRGRFAGAVGRPRLMGVEHEARGDSGFADLFLERAETERLETLALSLTGMGAVLLADEGGLTVVTDRMGARPVYVGHDGDGRLVAVGSHVESLARVCARERDFDLVSLGELIVHNYVTWPWTSREGIRELEPGSITRFEARDPEPRVESRVYWEPHEPEVFPGEDELGEHLVSALREAGEDVTRGCSRVAVTLSGGKDSRAVMGAVPRERLAAGLTYCTRENRETDVARRVAESFGVPQVLVRRDGEFYSRLLAEGTRLLGTELRSNAHGMCVAENELSTSFDVVLGGQLSDTLLKDHFMPLDERERLRRKAAIERLKRVAKRALGRDTRASASVASTLGRGQVAWAVKPEIREEMAGRRSARLDRVRRLRPRTAEEWTRFWPVSRQDDSSHILGNSRLFASDTLFLHNSILEAARVASPEARVGGRLADRAFMRFYGVAAEIEDANTGLPMTAPERRVRARQRRLRRDPAARAAFKRLPQSGEPWNDVQGSWVDAELLQKLSPGWEGHRERAIACPEVADLLAGVLELPAREVIAAYDERLPATANQMVMQIAWLVGSTAARCAGVGPAPLATESKR